MKNNSSPSKFRSRKKQRKKSKKMPINSLKKKEANQHRDHEKDRDKNKQDDNNNVVFFIEEDAQVIESETLQPVCCEDGDTGYTYIDNVEIAPSFIERSKKQESTNLTEAQKNELKNLYTMSRDENKDPGQKLVEHTDNLISTPNRAEESKVMVKGVINHISEGSRHPLITIAIMLSNIRLVENLIKLGADVNRPSTDYKFPLFWALQTITAPFDQKRKDIAMRLLDEDITPSLTTIDGVRNNNNNNNNGFTILHYAVHFGHRDVVDKLLRRDDTSQFLNLRSNSGFTALLIAILRHHTDIALMLLNSRHILASINTACSVNENTPLLQSIICQEFEIFDCLLKKFPRELRASVNRQNYDGLNPLTYVFKHEDNEYERKRYHQALFSTFGNRVMLLKPTTEIENNKEIITYKFPDGWKPIC